MRTVSLCRSPWSGPPSITDDTVFDQVVALELESVSPALTIVEKVCRVVELLYDKPSGAVFPADFEYARGQGSVCSSRLEILEMIVEEGGSNSPAHRPATKLKPRCPETLLPDSGGGELQNHALSCWRHFAGAC